MAPNHNLHPDPTFAPFSFNVGFHLTGIQIDLSSGSLISRRDSPVSYYDNHDGQNCVCLPRNRTMHDVCNLTSKWRNLTYWGLKLHVKRSGVLFGKFEKLKGWQLEKPCLSIVDYKVISPFSCLGTRKLCPSIHFMYQPGFWVGGGGYSHLWTILCIWVRSKTVEYTMNRGKWSTQLLC